MKNKRTSPLPLVAICGILLLRTVWAQTSDTSCRHAKRNVTFNANGTLKSFNSPSYPRSYPVDLNCTYLFMAPKGYRIELTFTDFQMEGASPKCSNDYIVVRDGPDESSPLIGRFCGPDDPKKIISSTNYIWIYFVSNQEFFFEGFNGTYRLISEVEIAKCTSSNKMATLLSRGYITTPTFPAKYPPNRECTWSLEAPPGYFMRMTFHVFQTQCPNDKFIIRDGDQHGQLLGEYCGEQTPPEFRGRRLWLSFKSDDAIADAEDGFNVTYEALPFRGHISDHCTGGQKVLNTSIRGIIQSPWRPNNYPNNMNCVWMIRAPEGKRVKLTFESFHLQSPCEKDSVQVMDWTAGSNSPRKREYCGASTIPDIISSGQDVVVSFVSDSSERRPGFTAYYEVNGGLHDEAHTFYSLLTLIALYIVIR